MSCTVIFDFDGTLALGRGPIDAYVREVVDLADDAEFAAVVDVKLADFESGRSDAADAYDAVRHAAAERGVAAELLERAYHRSREILGTHAAPVEAPDSIVPFLERLGDVADVALATNSPPTRLAETLADMGIDRLLQTRHTSIGKPEGLSRLVEDALRRGPVLSVGDLFENDLAPAAALGADTAFVGPAWESFAGRTTMAAATLPELYDLIYAWAAAATSRPSGSPAASDSLGQ